MDPAVTHSCRELDELLVIKARQHQDGCVIYRFRGAIARVAEEQLRGVLAQAPGAVCLVLDLSGIICFDNFGLNVLREWIHQLQQAGTKISVTTTSTELAELLHMADFDPSVDILPITAAAAHASQGRLATFGHERRPMDLVHDGDLEINGDVSVNQRVTGRIMVHPARSVVLMGIAERGVVVAGGGLARIAGTAHGLFVGVGGHAVVSGTCVGSATNDGGELTIDGVVTGDVIQHAGSTKITASAAIWHGRQPA